MKKYTFIMLCLLNIAFSFGQEKEIEIEEKNIEHEDIAFAITEKVPVYPGCEGNDNRILKKCMSEKMTKFVSSNFNINQATKDNTLPPGRQRIIVQFKINKEGSISDIRAQAKYPSLEKEAIRVVQLLPKMEPGTQKGKPVNVLYALPITFIIDAPTPEQPRLETKKEKRARLKKERKLKKHNQD